MCVCVCVCVCVRACVCVLLLLLLFSLVGYILPLKYAFLMQPRTLSRDSHKKINLDMSLNLIRVRGSPFVILEECYIYF